MKRVSLKSRSKGRVPQIGEQLVQLGGETRGAQQGRAAAADAPRAKQAAGGVEAGDSLADRLAAAVTTRPVVEAPQATAGRFPVHADLQLPCARCGHAGIVADLTKTQNRVS